MEELDQEKLTPLLRLKYHSSIADAVADLGRRKRSDGIQPHSRGQSFAFATMIVTDDNRGSVPDLAERLRWSSRHLNPALAVLRDRDIATVSLNLDPEYVTAWLRATPRTRRFATDI